MSMVHKAFEFDWDSFESDLFPILVSAIANDDSEPLLKFIEQNIEEITDPYEGENLEENWRSEIALLPVQDLADYALTKFYSVAEEFGLGDSWMHTVDKLNQKEIDALLGNSIKGFDPGRYGSYFLSQEQLNHNLEILSNIVDPNIKQHLLNLSRMTKGLYVTF